MQVSHPCLRAYMALARKQDPIKVPMVPFQFPLQSSLKNITKSRGLQGPRERPEHHHRLQGADYGSCLVVTVRVLQTAGFHVFFACYSTLKSMVLQFPPAISGADGLATAMP